MITGNVYNRVFFIRAEQYGTAFTLDVGGRQYLVTAKHLIGATPPSELEFFHGNAWKRLSVKLVGITRDKVDIAVFAPNILLSPALELEPTSKGIIIGQDVYFVGYPYKMWTDAGDALAGRPCPFVKKGTLSSAFNFGDGVRTLFVDAINNEGFSGGPVVFSPPNLNQFSVAGVVSGFRTEYESVLDSEGSKTEMSVAYNSGFLIAYDISYALDLILANPIGLKLQSGV